MITLTTLRGDKLCILHSQIFSVESHGKKSFLKVGINHDKVYVQESLTEVMELMDLAKTSKNAK
ncbi:hypothetical protein [Rosenbergiella metrosideri]|uniref:hypothetical protein n=1 Tax=Rosenbergiella metrosideri TaxID=2921185 RepID=UPI001F4F61B1|nr:hypothetical protein [Rosenbergiella metrosideri]